MTRNAVVGLSVLLLSTGTSLSAPAGPGSGPARQETGRAAESPGPPRFEAGPNGARRTISPNAITALPMSNPYCFQPDPAFDACYVNVRYFAATDNGVGNILAYVKVAIDGRLVAKLGAFFENAIYFDHSMIHGPGFRVPCGLSGASGSPDPDVGKVYTVDVKAFDVTNNWVLDDQYPVGCPAYHP
jgi:hypothetical protein